MLLGKLPIIVGSPYNPESWLKGYAYQVPVPAWNWGTFLHLTDGGWRILAFRWLCIYDPETREAHYQPFFRADWVPAVKFQDFLAEPHLRVEFVVPLGKGKIMLTFPGSLAAFKKIGPVLGAWESWK